MKSKIEKLGKVSITVEKDYWNINKTYNRLTIVERQGTRTAYLSRKVVPIGIDITDRNYWITISKWADIPYEIVQEFGDSTELVISQKVITLKINELQELIDDINEIIGEGGSINERIDAAKSEVKSNIIDGASENTNTFKKVEDALNERYTKDETYNKEEVEQMVTPPNPDYKYYATYTDMVAETSHPAGAIYRVSSYDGTQVDATSYAEYIWNGSEYKLLAIKSQTNEVFDITVYNSNTKYTDLTAALGVNGDNVPLGVRKGGMNVKFVQSSDNKYVQWRLTALSWSTDLNDWVAENEDFRNEVMQEVNEAIEANTPIVVEGNVTNAPDEEDLTSVNVGGTDVLKFKDKAYTPLTYSGMGRKILRKNIVNGVNTLTQSMISDVNTIYVIQYDFTLGEYITVPASCVLEFDGGSLNNGTIILTENNELKGTKHQELLNVVVRLYGRNIHIHDIYSVSDMVEPAFYKPTSPGNPADISNLLIEDCTIISHGLENSLYEASSGRCINLAFDYDGDLLSKNIVIRNNRLYHRAMGVEFNNNKHDGVENKVRVENVSIIGNYIENIHTATKYGFNISLSGKINKSDVKANTFINGRLCLEIESGTDNVSVELNRFITNIKRDSYCDATCDESSGNNIRFISNTFGGEVRNNLYLHNFINCVFNNNCLRTEEIRFYKTKGLDFSGNTVDGRGAYNIIGLNGAKDSNIHDNILMQDADSYLFDCTLEDSIEPENNIIYNNKFKNGDGRTPWRSDTYSNDNAFYNNINIRTNNVYQGSGTTAQRPNKFLSIGQKYVDTEKNVTVYWDGSIWTNDVSPSSVEKVKTPYTIPDSAYGGLCLVTALFNSQTYVFIAEYSNTNNAVELTSKGDFIIARDANGGNLIVKASDDPTAEKSVYVTYIPSGIGNVSKFKI